MLFAAAQDVSIASYLVISQLSCYWRPAGGDIPDTAVLATVDARGPNAVLQPVDCSLSVKMHEGAASVVEAASVVQSVDVQLHQQQVGGMLNLCMLPLVMFVMQLSAVSKWEKGTEGHGKTC